MKVNKMNKDRLMIFREGDNGGGSGDGDASGSRGVTVFEEGKQEQQQSQQQQQQQQVTAPPQVDAAALAKSLGEELKGAFGERKEPQKELTPEEARKLLKFPEIDEEFMKKFGNIETTKAALEDFRDRLLTHIHTVNGMTRREMMDELDGKFKPAIEYVTKAQLRDRDSDFEKAYPVLAKPELKPIIEAVRTSLKDKTFANEQESQKAVAEGVAAVIKVHKPDFKLSDGSSPSKKNNDQSANGIPVTTSGSGGGGGGGGDEAAKKSWQKAF